MLTHLFKHESFVYELVFGYAFSRDNVCNDRLSARDRSRLIKSRDLNISCFLKCLSVLEQDTVFCSDTVADHYGNRSRQTKCAWTADYKDAYSAGEGESCCLPDQKPQDRRDDRDTYDCRYKIPRDGIRKFCDRCFGGCRIADHLNDLCEGRVFSDPGSLAPQKTGLIQRCR